MELYNSIIRKVEELAGSSTPRRCPYDPQGPGRTPAPLSW